MTCRICWISTAVLLALSTTLLTRFIILGDTQPSTDERTAIIVEPGERDLILEEMRSFLISVRAIVASANADEMPAVAEAARKLGIQAQGQVPAALMRHDICVTIFVSTHNQTIIQINKEVF